MKKIKSKKGVTLITVGIAIIIMLILLTTLVYRSTKNTQLQKLDNLYNDIQLLNEKVALYYYKHGALPVAGTYTGDLPPTETLNPNDNGVYYIIDITALENVTLSNNPNIEDNIYIINERSQTIYFPKGVTIDGEAYYRLPELFAKIMTEADIAEELERLEEEERRNNFIFIMDIPDNNRTYQLGMGWSAIVDLTIDWGDGQSSTVTAYNDVNRAHTYANAGIYTIKISGVASNAFWFQHEQRLISIISGFPENMCPNVTSLASTFWNCTNLTSIPEGLFANCPNVTSFDSVFYQCTNLTSIPEGLFANCPNVTNFINSFRECSSLTGSIPEGLFANCPNVESFAGTFSYCSNLTNIPEGLFANNTNVTGFEGTFDSCGNLTGSIPEGLFANCPNVTRFDSVFAFCGNLTGSIPEGLFANCPDVTDFSGAFKYCYNLTSIPEGLFANCPEVTWFGEIFTGCRMTSIPEGLFANCPNVESFSKAFNGTRITSIPEGLFSNCPNVTDFNGTFYNCLYLGGNAPEIWNMPTVTNYSWCFYQCYGLSNYASIPSGWK